MKQPVKIDKLIHILVLESIVQGLKRKDHHVPGLARKGFLGDTWFELAFEGHLRLKLSLF